jgi:Zn-dependent protease
MSPELTVLAVVVALVIPSYGFVYPALAGPNAGTMAQLDLVLSALALLCVWFLYGSEGQRFEVLGWDMPWWVFTVATHFVVEIPAVIWYYNKYNVWASLKPRDR